MLPNTFYIECAIVDKVRAVTNHHLPPHSQMAVVVKAVCDQAVRHVACGMAACADVERLFVAEPLERNVGIVGVLEVATAIGMKASHEAASLVVGPRLFRCRQRQREIVPSDQR